MTRLLTYYEINPLAWKKLVDESPYATWFQTQEAYQFYAANKQEMTPFACGVERDGELRAVCVGYVTKERCRIKQFYTRRAIIIGGPLIADSANEDDIARMLYTIRQPEVLITVSTFCPTWRNLPIYIETRNFHDYSRRKTVFDACGFAYQPHLNIQVPCDTAHTMSEQRQRQVKKAIKNGAIIVQATAEKEIHDWYQILQQLYHTKVRTPLFKKDFFLRFYRESRGIYLLVKYQDKVIGGMMCPILNTKAIYEWYVCGMDEDYRELYPSVMATHAAIEYAKAHGIAMLDFMGAGQPNVPYGVRDFKMEFGGELVEHGRYVCVQKLVLYRIGKWGVRWLKRNR